MRGTSGKVVHFSEVALFPKLTFQLVLVLDRLQKSRQVTSLFISYQLL